jgi:hypothetical protein
MIYIIETHLSLNNENIICDNQARVIRYSSWDDYIELIKSGKYELGNGTMDGCILPRNAKVENLFYSDSNLSCNVITTLNNKIIKFAYLVKGSIPV